MQKTVNKVPKKFGGFDNKQNRSWRLKKPGFQASRSFNDLNSRRLQMFSGKRGK